MLRNRKETARRLWATREALGISQADLCRRIKCAPNRWSQYETGKRNITLDIAFRLRDEFRLSLDWVLDGDPSQLPTMLRLKIDSFLRKVAA